MDLQKVLLTGVATAVVCGAVQRLARDIKRYMQRPGRVLSVAEDLNTMFAVLQSLRERFADERAPAAGELYDFSVRWGSLLAGTLARLASLHDAGRLSADQASRYRALCGELREMLPVIDRIGLVQPTVALGDTKSAIDRQERVHES